MAPGWGVVVIKPVGEDAVHQHRIAHWQFDAHADDAVAAAFGKVEDAGQCMLREIKTGGGEGGADDVEHMQLRTLAYGLRDRGRRQLGGEFGNLLRDGKRGGGCGVRGGLGGHGHGYGVRLSDDR